MRKKVVVQEIDHFVGENIRMLRMRQGVSQKDLARACGITFQQIQKYESAGNRISASRLYDIAQALEVPVGALFGDGDRDASLHDRDMRNFIQSVYRLDPADRRIIFKMAHRLAALTPRHIESV